MFRSRDVVAILAALLLTRMAWNDGTESLEAALPLAFYLPQTPGLSSSSSSQPTTKVSPMDLDGDGSNEALAVLRQTTIGSSHQSVWELQVVDLKDLHQSRTSSSNSNLNILSGGNSANARPSLIHNRAPFQPPLLFSTQNVHPNHQAVPLQFTTGHVLWDTSKVGKDNTADSKTSTVTYSNVEINDRNQHFFCGMDWHDASKGCAHPCPGGQATECPDGQRCFADTPCNFHQHQANQKEDKDDAFDPTGEGLQLTPGGSLPSIITLWSDGSVTLHSIAIDKDNTKKNSMELRLMWTKQILPLDDASLKSILWVESTLLFLDAFQSLAATKAGHGMIVLSGIYVNEEESNPEYSGTPFVVALSAKDGSRLWDSFPNKELGDEDPVPLPIRRGTTSYARRRSRVVDLGGALGGADETPTNLPDCHVAFPRHHLQDVLPYAYWSSKDARIAAIHLDPSKKGHSHNTKHRNHHKKHNHQRHDTKGGGISKGNHPGGHLAKKKWHHSLNFGGGQSPAKHSATHGRPNVLVLHARGGLQIRSIRNGRPLCHTTLMEEALYVDLNNDGIIDELQLWMDTSKEKNTTEQWIEGLVKRKVFESDQKEFRKKKKQQDPEIHLCHAIASSGIPHQEDLFISSLCGTAREHKIHSSLDVKALAPIVVEPLGGRRNTRDAIVALNNGMVHRLQGRSGRKEWTLVGQRTESQLVQGGFPTWDEQGSGTALLARVRSSYIPAPLQPILLVGEQSMAILSVKTGRILAQVPFPQISIGRPLLAEVSGDGTADILVQSKDGIWGYQIQVRQGSPVGLRIAVGLLLFGLLLAVLRNRFGPKERLTSSSSRVRKDVRATDE